MDAQAILFSIPAYTSLAARLAETAQLRQGMLDYRMFPDGERYLRITSDVTQQDVILLGGTSSDAATLDVFDVASGLVRHGARTLTLIIPFFGYSTMERAVKPGEVVTAKTRARLLSAIPLAPGGNRVALLDLHADGIPHYFEGGMVPHHLYAKSIILEASKELGGERFALGSVDAGRAKWVESLANDLGVMASFILKRRVDARRTEVIALSASVQGVPVVIYDDMIRTGGSLLGAARAYLDAGATKVSAVCTHGLFPEDALERIRASGLIERVICTDSHPRAMAMAGKDAFVEVRSCVPVLASFIHGLQRREG